MAKVKMIRCEVCHEPIAAGVKVCPHCGARKGKTKASNFFHFALVIIGICIIGYLVLRGLAFRETPELEKARSLSKDAFVKQCKEIDYKDLQHYEEDYKGAFIKVNVQISTTSDAAMYYGRTKSENDFDDIGWFGDWYCFFDQREDASVNIVQDDYVTIYGIFTMISSSDDMPMIDAVYIDLIE